MSDELAGGGAPETGGAAPETGGTPPPASAPGGAPQEEPTGGDGHWLDNVEDEALRANEGLRKFKSPEAVAKSYVEMEKMLGSGKRVVVPGEDATPEDIAAFRKGLGVPEEASGYEFATEGIPEGMLQDGDLDTWSGMAHKHGLTPAQAQGVMQDFLTWSGEINDQRMAQANAKWDENQKSVEAALKQELGADFEPKMRAAINAAKQFGGQEFVDYLNQTGMGNDPRMIKTWMNISDALSEGSLKGGGRPASSFSSPDAAKEKIEALNRDKEFQAAYTDKNHAGHKGAVTLMTRLHETAYPEE